MSFSRIFHIKIHLGSLNRNYTQNHVFRAFNTKELKGPIITQLLCHTWTLPGNSTAWSICGFVDIRDSTTSNSSSGVRVPRGWVPISPGLVIIGEKGKIKPRMWAQRCVRFERTWFSFRLDSDTFNQSKAQKLWTYSSASRINVQILYKNTSFIELINLWNTLTETLIAVQKYATSVYCMTPKRFFKNTVRFSTILCCNMTVYFLRTFDHNSKIMTTKLV